MLSDIKNPFKTATLFLCWMTYKVLNKKQKPAILMYHSFDQISWRYGVSPRQIEKQISYLVKQKSIVPLDECVAYVKDQANHIPKNSISITIDDGYADTYSVFFPLAKKYNIPFTLFLTTDLQRRPNLGNLPRPNWGQIKEMYSSGLMTVGLHGHTHEHFTKIISSGSETIQREITRSMKLIEDNLGCIPHIAAYPSGQYNDDVITCIKHIGLTAAVATHSGFIFPGDDVYRLKRIEINRSMNFLQFKMRLTPALDIYNRLLKYIK